MRGAGGLGPGPQGDVPATWSPGSPRTSEGAARGASQMCLQEAAGRRPGVWRASLLPRRQAPPLVSPLAWPVCTRFESCTGLDMPFGASLSHTWGPGAAPRPSSPPVGVTRAGGRGGTARPGRLQTVPVQVVTLGPCSTFPTPVPAALPALPPDGKASAGCSKEPDFSQQTPTRLIIQVPGWLAPAALLRHLPRAPGPVQSNELDPEKKREICP